MSGPVTPPDIGKPPELAWLPVERLVVNSDYQRTLDSRASLVLIEKIAREFNWAAFGAILTVPRGEGWEMYDGQHRVAAARRRGIAHVPAVVNDLASVDQLAAIFVRANLNRVTLNPFSLHHAQLAAGDFTARAIAAVCTKTGLSIPRTGMALAQLKPGQTMALGAIAILINSQGQEAATLVLTAAARAFGSSPGGIRSALVRALTRVLVATPPLDRAERFEQIARWLARHTPDDLHTKALARRAQRGGNEVTNIAEMIRAGIAAVPPVRAGSAMRAPTLEQLMAGR